MPRRRYAVLSAIACLSLLAAALFWKGVLADGETAPPVAEPTKELGGPDRYLTAVSTDKPIYKPGETVYLRAVTLHHTTRAPLPTDQQSRTQIEITGPKGDVVAGGTVTTEKSVAGFSWQVPEEQAGGEYKITVKHPSSGYAPATRKFDIRNYQPPRLKTQVKFVRDGYGPGDEVVATLDAKRAEGGVPADAKVTVVARLDGEEIYRGVAKIDSQGKTIARFELPTAIRRGEGTLAMTIEDGGVIETASKTIPVLLQTVDMNMYPEGGELVAGLLNRVYFEAFTPVGKPADLAGEVVNAEGEKVGTFRSEHEGRGRFEVTPVEGETYSLKITEPSGITGLYPLPETTAAGVVLNSKQNTYTAEQPITLAVGVQPAEDAVKIVAYQREQPVASVATKGGAATRVATLEIPRTVSGVLRITAFAADGKPVAERLVYRQPASHVNVEIVPDAKQYTPGGKTSLKIKTTDKNGDPVAAVIGLTATDDSVLEMIEKREQSARLPVMMLLEPEVKDLADAHVYLDSTNKQAPLATDLLLGTQGWRRFALVDFPKFLSEHGDDARRISALRIVQAPIPTFRRFNNFAAPEAAFGNIKKLKGEAVAEAPVDELEKAAAVEGAPLVAEPVAPPAIAPPGKNVPPAGQGPAVAEPVAGAAKRDANFMKRPAASKPRAPIAQDRQELRQALQEAEADVAGDAFFADEAAEFHRQPMRNDFQVVRIFAHQVRENRQPNERTDFSETLFWAAALETDADGIATVEFGLSDNVTSFRIQADAFTAAGALGAGSHVIDSVEPFYLEPKLPLEVTAGDKIQLPIALVNGTGTDLGSAQYQVAVGELLKAMQSSGAVDLSAGARARQIIELSALSGNGPTDVALSATAGSFSDKVTRSIVVRPQGFPIEFGRGGLLEPNSLAFHEVTIPADIVSGSFSGKLIVYPTPLASMTSALERLIREPNGCFEQTSSSTYPLVMAQQYFQSHQGVDPTLITRSEEMLAKGYDRLMGFESSGGGFEWFGGPQGHDALTAYGLMEFTDMAKVRAVDSKMLARTREWLLAQRDGKGGYERKTNTLHTWITDPECAASYNTWALLEAGIKADLDVETAFARSIGEKATNTYAVALAACVVGKAGDKEGENHLLDKLAGKQASDGSVEDATTSVVGSGGDALKIEATSLAVLAWLNNPRYASNVEQGIKFLAESCKAGRFGSTQSTILALKAIVEYDASRAQPKAPGSLQLVIDGKPIGEPVAFDKETQGAIELPAIENLTVGKHTLAVRMTDGSRMPYSVALDYHRMQPDSAEECNVHLKVELSDQQAEEGDVVEAQVAVVNRTNEAIPNPIAIIGLPGGLEPRHDQLKELVKSEKIAAYEVRGREVILYWRSLAAEERVALPISTVARIPGEYAGPASRAYLYYTDEHKNWQPSMKIAISPKG